MDTVKDIVADFVVNRNRLGTVTDGGTVSQNDVLWNAIYVAILAQHGQLDDQERLRIFNAVNPYLADDGHTLRTPESKELDSADNLVGWIVHAFFIEPAWATRILYYHDENAGMWPGVGTDAQRWLGRFKALFGYLRMISPMHKITFEDQFWILVSGVVSCFAGKYTQDPWIHGHLLAMVAERSPKTPPAVKLGVAVYRIVSKARGLGINYALNNFGRGWKKFAAYFA